MQIKGREIKIDVLEELKEFHWNKGIVKGNKFQACSPFRPEVHPSFAVNLDNGTWVDSGSVVEDLHKGNFIKLLALLRHIDYDEAEDDLLERYDIKISETDKLKLNLDLQLEPKPIRYFTLEELEYLYKVPTNYLDKRGISREVQKLFNIGYSEQLNAVAMPWMDKLGRIINVKYRLLDRKKFLYEKDGQEIRYYLYGLYQCLLVNARKVYICESETDALTLWTYNQPAIALGGSSISESQEKLLLSTNIEEVVIATDNDNVGNRIRAVLEQELLPYFKVFNLKFSKNIKDVNEMSEKQIKEAIITLSEVDIIKSQKYQVYRSLIT